MASLIPAIGTCVSRMTGGEKRFAYRLESKLEDDWLLWYDVPLGPRNVHPDFVVFNPRRGLLVLEVKDWKLETIQDIDRQSVSIITAHGLKRVANPLEQARQYAHEVSNLLQRDPQLTINSGRMQGTLLFPWSYGVVLANISRKQFDSTNLGEVIEPHRVICQDEMTESTDTEVFQECLWGIKGLKGSDPFGPVTPLDLKSAQLAPDAILLPANFEAYRDCSRRFKAAVASIAPKIEDRGIDEIYIDLSDIQEATNPLAQRIKQAVFAATGLTCSIGISPNKLLAKICSDLEKPDGVTVLEMADVPTRIWLLPAKKINGIGPKASEKLAQLGINTIGELAATPLEFLVHKFGRTTGVWLNKVAHGIDERPVVTESEPKSVSRESTFERDLHVKQDRAELSEIFTALCMRVADDLKRKGYVSRTIGIKLRYSDFQAVTRDVTLPIGVSEGLDIRKAAGECLKRIPLTRRIRLLGVRASGLMPLSDVNAKFYGLQAELPF